MDAETLKFKELIKDSMHLLEHMDSAQRSNLALFWKDISPKFDQIFAQLEDISDNNIDQEQEERFCGCSDTEADGDAGDMPAATTIILKQADETELKFQPSGDSLIQVGSLIIDLDKANPALDPSTRPEYSYKSKRRTLDVNKERENGTIDQPRRSNRKVKLPSLYNDFVTTSALYIKSEDLMSTDHTADSEEQMSHFFSDNNPPNEQLSGHTMSCSDSTQITNIISIRTVNPFPSDSSLDQPVQLDPGETVFQLRLSTNPSAQVKDQDIIDTYQDYSDQATEQQVGIHSDQATEQQVGILVTNVNDEPQTTANFEPEEVNEPNQEIDANERVGMDLHAIDEDSQTETQLDEEAALGTEECNKEIKSPSTSQKCRRRLKTTNKKDSSKLRVGVKKNMDGLYECPECDKKISNYSNLRVHMRIHSGEKPYGCRMCGRLFSTITNMVRHERTTHNKEKLYHCEQCQKNFTEKKSLVIHQRIHTGERPYKCTICTQAFAQAGTLKTHLHRHMGIKGHLCDFCGKSFRQKSQLCMHQRRHADIRNFKCTDCPKAFVTKTELVRHHTSHSGERPYLCSLCPKTFTRLQYLKEHNNFHTNTTPYQCKVCGQAFRDLASHAKHVKRHGLASNIGEASEEKVKETFIFLPEADAELYMQDIETTGNTDQIQTIQVPTMVTEECVEEATEEVELDISNLATAMQHPNMMGVVEVSTSQAATYIGDIPTSVDGSSGEAGNQVAIEVHTLPPGIDVSQLSPGKRYILIEQLSEQVMEHVETTFDVDDNINVVEVSSQED